VEAPKGDKAKGGVLFSEMKRTAEAGPSKDALLDATPKAAAELSEQELNKVAGGKAKTADKAYNAMDAYIKS
jgi:hypothetical protein